MTTSSIRAGDTLGGRWTVETVLGTGGFSTVYLAHAPGGPPHRVALKVLEVEPTTLQSGERLFQEARIVAALESPYIAPVRDAGTLDDGRPFLVMDFVDAPDLGGLLIDEGPFDVETTVEVVRCVLCALETVHDAGIVHRDIKPENVLVRADAEPARRAVVTDFGVAKILDAGVPRYGEGVRTDDGLLIGSPGFAAPELFLGQPDYASDQFAVGMMMVVMVTGKHLLGRGSMRDVFRHYASPRPLPFPEALRDHVLFEVIERALRKAPGDRFGDVRDMRSALDAAVGQERQVQPGGGPSSRPV